MGFKDEYPEDIRISESNKIMKKYLPYIIVGVVLSSSPIRKYAWYKFLISGGI